MTCVSDSFSSILVLEYIVYSFSFLRAISLSC